MVFWVWLATRYSTSSPIPKRIAEYFGSAYNAFNADIDEYKKLTRSYEKLLDKDIKRAMDIVEYAKNNNIGIITYNQLEFPQRLKKLDNCPVVLYYMGNLYDLDDIPAIGVVGTRNYTPMGEKVTKRVSYDLARSGFTIISGLAKGIDSFSHRAALYNESPTVAVLGCGIDVIYPPENRELTMQMRKEGLVITEFHPGTRPLAHNFPARNRIISGLSDGIFVAECGMKSGTMITADYAFENDIPVYMYEELCTDAVGYLRERGAVGIKHSDNITLDLKEKYPFLKLASEVPEKKASKPKSNIASSNTVSGYGERKSSLRDTEPASVSEADISDIIATLKDDEKKLVLKLAGGPLAADALVDDDLPIQNVLRILTSLELKDVIMSLPGGRFAINKYI